MSVTLCTLYSHISLAGCRSIALDVVLPLLQACNPATVCFVDVSESGVAWYDFNVQRIRSHLPFAKVLPWARSGPPSGWTSGDSSADNVDSDMDEHRTQHGWGVMSLDLDASSSDDNGERLPPRAHAQRGGSDSEPSTAGSAAHFVLGNGAFSDSDDEDLQAALAASLLLQ